jgi:isoquinoline 1-oxidoreductase beta subunit
MNSFIKDTDVSRRSFLAGSGGLVFSITVGGWLSAKSEAVLAQSGRSDITAWVKIGTDGSILIYAPAAEMGQGVNTSLPQILAEELDADWSKVVVEQSPHDAKTYGNPGFGGGLTTVASKSVSGYHDKIRIAGAQARRVLMDAAAAKWGVPVAELTTQPSMVVHAKSGRKMSYGEIAGFAKMPDALPEITTADLKKPANYRIVGKSVTRIDMKAKATGAYQYGMDVQVPGMLYAALARTPVEGATVESVKDEAAKKVPGVAGVIALKDAVGVIGSSVEATKKAKELLEIKWSAGKIAGYNSAQSMAEYQKRATDLGDKGLVYNQIGDAPAAMKGAAKIYKADFTSDYAYHAQMEPMNVTAKVDDDGMGADIWVGTQAPDLLAAVAAGVLGTKPPQIRIHQVGMGGGFGRRIYPDHVAYALLLSKASKKPIKVIWSREDDVAAGKLRPMTAHHLEAGVDKDGKIVAWHHRLVGESVIGYTGPAQRLAASKGLDDLTMEGSKFEYAIPNQFVEFVRAREGKEVALAAWRAIGSGYNKFVVEAFLDEIAHGQKKDPIAFHLALLEKDARARKVIETVAKMSNWSKKREGTHLGFSFNHVWSTPAAAVIELSVDKSNGDVKLHNMWAAVNPGLVISPDGTKAQMESNLVFGLSQALKERITYSGGAIDQSNFHDYELIRMSEVPEIFVEVISTPNEKPSAMGEVGLPLVGGCVANALFQATGKRMRAMPFTPERIMATLKA